MEKPLLHCTRVIICIINWLLRVTCVVTVAVETVGATAPQASSDHDAESEEEQIKEKPKKTSTLTVPGKKTKQKALKSPKRRKKVSKTREGGKEDEKGDNEDKEEEEEIVEEEHKKETGAIIKKEKKGLGFKRRDLVVGECREEKAPYVTVREARMVTLADKVSSQL